MMIRRLAFTLLLALAPSLALAQVNNQNFSVAAYVKYVLSGNIVIGGNLTVGGSIIDNTNGISLNNPTGGLKGPGTINVAADYYKNGTIIPETVSSPLTLTAGNLACPACVLISGTGHGDSNYQILSTDRYVFINAAFTAPRVWTLPAANSVTVGTTIWVQDALNTITSANTLTVQRAGTDTLNGVGTSTVITGNSGGITFTSDGVSNWGVPEQTVTTGGTGQGTLTNHGVLVGAGINPVSQTAVGTTDHPLIGQTGADPVFSKLALTNPATGSTLTIADGKTLTSNNTITLASAIDGGTYTFPNTSGSVATISALQTFTNKTYDTAGAGNSFLINGLAATANTGTGAVVRATSPALVTPALGTPASGVATNLTGLPLTTGVTGTLPVANGGTGDTGTAWSTYTPTLACGSGTFTTATAAGRFKQIGKTVYVAILITDTTNGTCASFISATLPVVDNNATLNQVLFGREAAGTAVLANMSAGTIFVKKYDTTYPGFTGASIVMEGVYEAN